MFIRALLAFLALPGLAAFVAPLYLVKIDHWKAGIFPPGVILLLLGAFLLLWCVRDFYVAGKGTVAPWDPPKRLVVVGLYRHVRNPMYIGVVTLVCGWTALYRSPVILLYALVLALAFHVRVLTYEEPHLSRQFGNAWVEYRAHVGRWLPRWTPWKGAS